MKIAVPFLLFSTLFSGAATATTVTFFDSSQVATLVESGTTSDTISSNGYLFTYTRDKLFTGGTGDITGRYVRVPWPEGVEAQAVTTTPTSKAQIVLKRVDGNVFDITAFTAKLLANTWGAGGAIEVMPLLDGEDGYSDPIAFNASGSYSQSFSYNALSTPSTTLLKGFDAYKINLYVDFALTGLTLVDASIAPAPIPASTWLLGSGLLGLIGVARRKIA